MVTGEAGELLARSGIAESQRPVPASRNERLVVDGQRSTGSLTSFWD